MSAPVSSAVGGSVVLYPGDRLFSHFRTILWRQYVISSLIQVVVYSVVNSLDVSVPGLQVDRSASQEEEADVKSDLTGILQVRLFLICKSLSLSGHTYKHTYTQVYTHIHHRSHIDGRTADWQMRRTPQMTPAALYDKWREVQRRVIFCIEGRVIFYTFQTQCVW